MILRYEFATPDYDQAIRLRDEVLRKPLGRSIVDDPLEEEVYQVHFAYFDDGIVLGTASLLEVEPGVWKMRQVAVGPAAQGKSVGRQLVQACRAFAKTHRANRLYCHARDTAKGFYERCDWEAFGEPFEEVGLAHTKMRDPYFEGKV